MGVEVLHAASSQVGTGNFVASGPAVVPVTIQGAAAQSASLTEWKNSAGTVVASVGPAGAAFFPSVKIGTATGAVFDAPSLTGDAGVVLQPSASNTIALAFVMPKGVPAATQRSTLSLFGTDFRADSTNFETLSFKVFSNVDYKIVPEAGGTGTLRGLTIGSAAGKLGAYGVTAIVRPTTAGAAAVFVANTSLIANDTATFDGYTIGQVVKALRNLGWLT